MAKIALIDAEIVALKRERALSESELGVIAAPAKPSAVGPIRSPTENRIIAILDRAGDWVPVDDLRRLIGRNSYFQAALRRLHESDVIQQRAETLTDNRGPGWLGEELRKRFGDSWSKEATDFAYAYRLTPPRTAA